MDLLTDLITSFDPSNPNFRPTELFNENWLLKLVLRQMSAINDGEYPVGFLRGSTWFSEALLPTAFKPRFRRDPLGESRTNADGVIGHILIGRKAKADLELKPDATQFTVVEAKISSPLSSGTKNASYFDQAARNVACMASVLAKAGTEPGTMSRFDFVVLAPQYAIDKGTFANEMRPGSIRAKVEKRVSAYDGGLDDWHANHFEPTMDLIQLHTVSWEDSIGWIGKERPQVARALSDFYQRCLEFN